MARKKILDIMGNIAIIILYHVISIYNGQYTMMISPNCCPARPQGRTAAPSLPRWLHARRRSTWQSCPATPWRWKDIICIYIYDLYIYIHIKYKHTYIIQYICLAYTVHMHVSAMIRWDAILKKRSKIIRQWIWS
jgi:hypothetical protein